MVSTCEFREEYACYKTAICERNTEGKCGWRQTEELTSCIAAAKCDPFANPAKRYVGDPKTCMLIKFICEEGTHHFSDECGCGCEND